MTVEHQTLFPGTRFRWLGVSAPANNSMSVVGRENVAALRALGWREVSAGDIADVVISFHHQDHPCVAPDRSGCVRIFYLCTGGHNAVIKDYVANLRQVAQCPRNHIFVLNRSSQAAFAEAGVPTHIWNHGVNLEEFQPKPPSVGRPLTFGFVGQGEAFKRHEFLVECFVDAFGDEPGRARLLLMTGWGHVPGFPDLPGNVNIVPARSHADMANFYHSLDCLVNYSYAEGYNLPILEALACGVPCVVTDMPEMREPPFDTLCRHVRAERILDTSRFMDAPFAPRDVERYFTTPWVRRVRREEGVRALREFAEAPVPRRGSALPEEYSWGGRIRNQVLPVIAGDLRGDRSQAAPDVLVQRRRPAGGAAALPLNRRPGRARSERISPEGLARLEQQLRAGARMSPQVLEQWVKRYGDQARKLIARYREQSS